MEANPTILIKDYEDPKLWDNLEQLDKKREEVVEKQPPEFPNNLGYPNLVFDIDGTLCDSDPLHCIAFCEMFSEIGMEVPDDEFVSKNIAGKHNDDIAAVLFPDDIPKGVKLASENLPSIKGLYKLTKWIEDRGLKRAAVANAPKQNAETHDLQTRSPRLF
ncbi:hypothetical protein V6N13_138399 [Hibiscus sabdariffa]